FPFPDALALKCRVSNGTDFVNQQDLRFQVSCDGESKTHIHSAAVAFHRSIQKLFDFGEGDDFVKLPADLGACHAQNGAIQKNVFAAGKLGVKACADFEQARDSTTNADAPFGGLRNAAE